MTARDSGYARKGFQRADLSGFLNLTDPKALNFTAQQLQLLIWNGNPNTYTAPLWKKIKN